MLYGGITVKSHSRDYFFTEVIYGYLKRNKSKVKICTLGQPILLCWMVWNKC